MKLVSSVVAVVAVVAATHSASAECRNPHWLGTPAGATIPATGSLYLYDRDAEPRAHQTRISDTVVRIDYTSTADELEFANEGVVYRVDKQWRAPEAAPRVLVSWHNKVDATSADSVMLQIDQPTAAFRVRWEFAGKQPREWIVPARSSHTNASVLELGKLACAATTIDPDELAAGGVLTLFAIRFDGSEVAVVGLPAIVSTAAMRTSTRGVDDAMAMLDAQAPPAPSAPRLDIDLHFPFYMLIFGVVLLAGLLWVKVHNRAPKPVA